LVVPRWDCPKITVGCQRPVIGGPKIKKKTKHKPITLVSSVVAVVVVVASD